LRPRARILALNKWLKDYCAKNRLVYLDYFSALVDERGMLQRALADDGSLFQSKDEPGEEPERWWWRKLLSDLDFGTNLAAGAVGMWKARLCCLRFPRKRIIPRSWG
jgi:hypothetical protein